MTADMLERMAARTTKPVITPTKTPPIDIDPDDMLGIGKLRSSSAAANVLGNKPFTGPTLDPEVIAARAQLGQKALTAVSQGVDPGRVQAIAGGEGDPNRGFLGPAKYVGGKLKGGLSTLIPDVIPQTRVDISDLLEPVGGKVGAVGKALLKGAEPTLDKFDLGRRFFTSALKELNEEDGSFRDFYNQTFAGTFGLGDKFKADDPAIIAEAAKYQTAPGVQMTPKELAAIKNKQQAVGYGDLINTGNIYADQLLGFIGDIVLDPTTYIAGPGGIAKTAGTRALLKGGKAATRYADNAARLAESAFKKRLAEEAIEAATRVGDDAAAEAARRALKAADIQSAKASKALSMDAATRQIGRSSNQALAESVIKVKDDAQGFVDQATQIIGIDPKGVNVTALTKQIDDEIRGLGPTGIPDPDSLVQRITNSGIGLQPAEFLEQYASALATVDALSPAVIKNIQKSGLVGIAGGFVDIIKGKRTAAQDVLGVSGGLRLYNPLNVFDVGPRRFKIAGTERLTNVAGLLLSGGRVNAAKYFPAILNRVVPTGEGGLLGSEDLLTLRQGLRSGSFAGEKAEEATRLIALDNRYRALVNNERKVTAGTLENFVNSGIKNITKEDLNAALPYLQTDPKNWTKAGLPALTPGGEVEKAYNAIKNQMEDFYSYAAGASGATGYKPPKRSNYFPQMQTRQAIRWAERNPKKAEELAKALNVDRTWFVGNFRARDLKPGNIWFGHKLEAEDLNVMRLNELARNPKKGTGITGLDFDYFETDVLTAIRKYADKHAQFSALQKTIGEIPETQPAIAARNFGPPNAYDFKKVQGTTPVTAINVSLLSSFDQVGDLLLNPESLASITPDIAQDALAAARTVVARLEKPKVIKERLIDELDQLDDRLADFVNAATPVPPAAGAVVSDEVLKLARLLYEEVDRGLKDVVGIPVSRYAEYVDDVRKGLVELNMYTAPNIAVSEAIAEMFTNASRLSDQAFANQAKQLLREYTRFSKTYLVMRPGFYLRNALSNMFQFIVAGGNPIVGNQGVRLQSAVQDALKSGKSVRQIAKNIVDNGEKYGLKVTNDAQRFQLIEALTDTINYSGATGFGQIGEIAQVLDTERLGFLGGPITEKPVLKQVSKPFGVVAEKSRKIGTGIENTFRFGLMWDGIVKGLTPQEAAARVNKYLIDYSDYSKADRVGRGVFPFWTFMTRNAPLQLELMWTNPRAYAWYNSAKRNLEDKRTEEEGGMIIPSYERDRGVFALENPLDINVPDKIPFLPDRVPISVVRPGLPFEGGGENVLSTLIQEPTKLLANINPLFRAPMEAFLRGERGEKFFTGGKVVPFEQTDQPLPAKMTYLIRELAAPASPLRSIVAFVPADDRPELLNSLLGLTPDDDQNNIQELQALLNWGGVPLGNIRTEQQKRELESRAYKIGALLDAKRAAKKKEREKQMKTPSDVTLDPNDLLGIDKLRGNQP